MALSADFSTGQGRTMAEQDRAIEDWKAEHGLDVYSDRELFELIARYLERDNGQAFFKLLADVKDEAASDPRLQAAIGKICRHPRFKALIRH
jgi:hypothetical protein